MLTIKEDIDPIKKLIYSCSISSLKKELKNTKPFYFRKKNKSENLKRDNG